MMARPLDSVQSFRYLGYFMRIIGLNPFAKWRWLYWCYSLFMMIGIIIFPVHMIVQLFYTVEFYRIVNILTVTMTTGFAPAKLMIIFYYSRTNLQEIDAHLSELDRRAELHAADRAVVAQMIRMCQGIFRLWLFVYTAAIYGYAVPGLLKHTLVFEGWIPFDWTTSRWAYFCAFMYQLISVHITLIQNVIVDSYGPIYLNIMVAHMHALNMRVTRLGEETGQSCAQNYQDLIDCIEDHKQCMAAIDCLRPVMAGTMFVQMMITAFVLCTSAIGYLSSDRNVAQLFTAIIYLFGIVLEILPCSWYANVLMDEIHELTAALYSCRWYDQDQRFRKSILIFMQRSQRKTELLAGNIVPISLESSIAVIKFSFSLYTILS